MTYSPPPFRAEHIGSLLRPAGLLEKRQQFARGEISRDALTVAEDQAIADAVALQKRVGLRLATDGEFRRQSYHTFFYEQLGDIRLEERASTDGQGRGAQPQFRIASRLNWTKPIHVDDFLLLRGATDALPKITIPGPCALHFRGGDAAVLAQRLSRCRRSSGTIPSRHSARN